MFGDVLAKAAKLKYRPMTTPYGVFVHGNDIRPDLPTEPNIANEIANIMKQLATQQLSIKSINDSHSKVDARINDLLTRIKVLELIANQPVPIINPHKLDDLSSRIDTLELSVKQNKFSTTLNSLSSRIHSLEQAKHIVEPDRLKPLGIADAEPPKPNEILKEYSYFSKFNFYLLFVIFLFMALLLGYMNY